jgi:hypothetical protein
LRRRALTIWLREYSQLVDVAIFTGIAVDFSICRALYIRGSDYETSDAVFGVKESLIVGLDTVTPEQANKYNVKEGTKLLTYDFVLVTDEETKKLRHEEAVKAMQSLGREGMTIINGLPVPDVD